MANQRILFLSDNEATIYVVNKMSSKDPIMMKLVRRLVVATMKFIIVYRCKHMPGKINNIADKFPITGSQKMGTMASRRPMCSSNSYAMHLTPDASKIVMASLDKKTKSAYWNVWRRFTDFCRANGVRSSLPVSVFSLLNFLTSCFIWVTSLQRLRLMFLQSLSYRRFNGFWPQFILLEAQDF